MDTSKLDYLSISDFYNQKSIFITGGTGFLGKLIIEKLLRSCSGVGNIYILCRSKESENLQVRFEKLKSCPIFNEIKKINPHALDKMRLIEGDVSKLNLGISSKDRELLIENVSIIINSAATINFNEPLKSAINTNLCSTRELLFLGKEMKSLKSLVHISTAYTNWFDGDVKEEIKPTPNDPKHMMEIINNLPDKAIEELKPQFLGKHVNTYTYTKALAENYLLNNSDSIPVAIVRPPLVGGSMKEPIPGWIDTMSALGPYLYAISKGTFRATIIGNKYSPCEFIPADLVTNITIAAAWKVAIDKSSSSPSSFPQVYHITTGAQNPFSWKDFIDSAISLGRTYPLETVSWYPKNRIYKYPSLFLVDCFITHAIPAYAMILYSKVLGKSPRKYYFQLNFLKNYYKIVSFGTKAQYTFRATNFQNILKSMSKNDQKEFYFDPKIIKWNDYMRCYYFGIRRHILKEKDLTSMTSARRLTKLKYINYFVTATSFLTMMLIAKPIISSVENKKNN